MEEAAGVTAAGLARRCVRRLDDEIPESWITWPQGADTARAPRRVAL
ncbi:hypothetical protein [Streptomyces sp. KR80]